VLGGQKGGRRRGLGLRAAVGLFGFLMSWGGFSPLPSDGGGGCGWWGCAVFRVFSGVVGGVRCGFFFGLGCGDGRSGGFFFLG